MAIPLVKTKFYIPPMRPEWVSRSRLIERLDAGLHRKMTLISAPAGFGKTTLLSEWAAGGGRPVAWLSLDKSDNDPPRFWAYAIAALQTIPSLHERGVGESILEMLESPQPPPMRTLLTELINEIAESPAPTPGASAVRRMVLVLDDFHAITDTQIYDALTFLLDNLPPQLHLAIATRADPLLPLSRLRGRGQITELYAADLRFTLEEVTAFLNQAMGLALSTADIAALETRTEGWIAGLQMAAYVLQGMLSNPDQDPAQISDYCSALIQSHRYILDYLTDEVLLREPENVQSFLLCTSILDRLSGPLCDAVTGQGGSQDMLERLQAANLFLVPLDDEQRWFRYHHLFGELLRKRLGRMDPELAPTLHRRASEWYQDAHLAEEAIHHALAGGDFGRAAELIEQNAMQQMIASRQEATLSEWLEALPPELVRERPWLCVYQGWTRHWRGLREQVEECLQCAEQALEHAPESAAEEGGQLIAGYIAAIRAHHALIHQELDRVIEMAERAIAFLPEGDYMRCEAAVALGGAYWGKGDVLASQCAFDQARTTALSSGYRPLAVPASCYEGMQLAKQGRLQEAHLIYREGLECALGPGGRPFPVAGFPLIRLGDLSREWDDLEAAARDLARGLDLCLQLEQADVVAEGYVLFARLQLALGEHKRALDALEQAEQVSRRVHIDPWITSWADDCRIRLWLAAGDLDAAVRWAQQSELRLDSPLNYQHDLSHINLARVLIAQELANPGTSGWEPLRGLLDRLQVAADRAGWAHEEIQILILRALGSEGRGDLPGALDALGRALALAEPGGYVRIFVDEGAPMARLLRTAAERGIAPAYAGRLLAALGTPPLPTRPRRQEPGVTPVEPLSERELEVLQLVAQGLSNREIGQRLVISPGTVKAHTSSIYSKLGVRSRTQAVSRARALGML